MNKCILTGRLVKDIELRYTQSQKAVTDFTIAVGRTASDTTDFITCVAWNKLAENLSKYKHKGDLIGVFGEYRTEKYEKDGKTHYKNYVLVNDIEYFPNGKQSSQSNEEQSTNVNPFEEFGEHIKTETQTQADLQYEDDDLPF